MQKFFCDLCETQCSDRTTRRWEHVQGDLGVEVLLLRESNPISDMHLCDLCLIRLLCYAIEHKTPDAGFKKLQEALDRKEALVADRENEVSLNEKYLLELEQQLKAKERALGKREAELESARDVTIEENVKMFKQKEKDLIRQAEARGRQQLQDELDAERRRKENRVD